jgi:hypothetical protein
MHQDCYQHESRHTILPWTNQGVRFTVPPADPSPVHVPAASRLSCPCLARVIRHVLNFSKRI